MQPTVLITGGTGFLGKRLGLALKPHYAVVLAGRNHGQNNAAQEFTNCAVVAMDVTNLEAVRDLFAEVRPSIVIHAAANKYVDIAERQPMECIDVNVIGSQNVARVAVEKGTTIVVGMSTDKAAPPVSNTYGLCKALMERMYCSMNGKSVTRFTCVRPGNIPWSTGSVLPIWKKMHDSTGVIGTTGPEMTRFFSPAEEVVQLVKTAIDHIDQLQGKVVTRTMKAAQIGRILELWVANKGGSWRRIEGRPGERKHEFLLGELEVPYAREVEFQGVKHYVLAPNERVDRPLPAPLSSGDAEQLTDQEILAIINNPPAEER